MNGWVEGWMDQGFFAEEQTCHKMPGSRILTVGTTMANGRMRRMLDGIRTHSLACFKTESSAL
jgi:hypothetical protein